MTETGLPGGSRPSAASGPSRKPRDRESEAFSFIRREDRERAQAKAAEQARRDGGRMRRRRHDWRGMLTWYLSQPVSTLLDDVARHFGVPAGPLRRRAAIEGWQHQREELLCRTAETARKAIEEERAGQIVRLLQLEVRDSLEHLEQMHGWRKRNGENMDPDERRAYAAAWHQTSTIARRALRMDTGEQQGPVQITLGWAPSWLAGAIPGKQPPLPAAPEPADTGTITVENGGGDAEPKP